MGIGLIVSGIFTADAGAGFPVGAPEGAPDLSRHGTLHEVGHLCVGIAWIAVCLVFRSRFAQQGERGWARISVAVVPATVLLIAWPHIDSFPVRTVLASLLQLAYLGAVAVRVRR